MLKSPHFGNTYSNYTYDTDTMQKHRKHASERQCSKHVFPWIYQFMIENSFKKVDILFTLFYHMLNKLVEN